LLYYLNFFGLDYQAYGWLVNLFLYNSIWNCFLWSSCAASNLWAPPLVLKSFLCFVIFLRDWFSWIAMLLRELKAKDMWGQVSENVDGDPVNFSFYYLCYHYFVWWLNLWTGSSGKQALYEYDWLWHLCYWAFDPLDWIIFFTRVAILQWRLKYGCLYPITVDC